MPPEAEMYEVADFFRVFGDPTRFRILCALTASEMCVHDLAATLGMSQSAVSHQLRVMKQARVVHYRKIGRYVFYFLDDDHIARIVAQGLEHHREDR
jgi:ArsR family transcriptional regulator